MLIWITRPDILSVVIRGVSACTAWLVKPEYNFQSRGAMDELYPSHEIGWTAPCDDNSVKHAYQIKIGKSFQSYPHLTHKLIVGLHQSVGETIDPGSEFDRWHESLDRWSRLAINAYDDAADGRKHMCLPLEVPWELWFDLVQKASLTSDVKYARWLASLDPDNIPF